MAGNSTDTDGAESPPPRWRLLAVEVAICLGIAFGLTAWLTAGGRELNWHRELAGEDGSWPHGDGSFWSFLYHFATIPAFVIAVAAIAGLIAGFRIPQLRRWRRALWFTVLLLVLAAGLVVNLIFKEHWGRPRPREITDFGGRFAYETVFDPDPVSEGKSFPCGHAAAGFFFLGGWFIFRRRNRRWAYAFLGTGLGYGLLIGYMRMIQGGHFATDVVWSGAMTWIVAACLAAVLRPDLDLPESSTASEESRSKRIPLKYKLAGGVAGIALLIGGAFSWPYSARRDLAPLHPDAGKLPCYPSIRIALGDVEMIPGDQFKIKGSAWGHGLPTSQIADRWEETEDGNLLRIKYLQRLSGRLAEIRQDLDVEIPWHRTPAAKFDLGPGQVKLQLPASSEDKRIELLLNGTTLDLDLEPGAGIQFETGEFQTDIRDVETSPTPGEPTPGYRIVITGWNDSVIQVRRLKSN